MARAIPIPALVLTVLVSAPFAIATPTIAGSFADRTDPFITANCVKCHGEEK